MFRFTIRELVFVTVIVAMGVAWWLDHKGKAELENDARDMAWLSALPRDNFVWNNWNQVDMLHALQEKYGVPHREWVPVDTPFEP